MKTLYTHYLLGIAILLYSTAAISQTVEAGADRTICLGDEVQLQAGAGSDYQWTGTGLNQNDIANPIASPILTTEYYLEALDPDGVASFDTLTVFVVTQLDFSAGTDTIICQGLTIDIGSTPLMDASYTWTPDFAISATDVANPSVNPDVTTTYTVIAQNGSCVKESDITVSVIEYNISYEYEISASCEAFEVQFFNTSDASDNFWWDFGMDVLSTDNNPVKTLEPNTTHVVKLFAEKSTCTFSETKVIITDENNDELTKVSPSNVFSPNGDGVNDTFNIGISGSLKDCLTFEIYNRWGERVFTSIAGNTTWDGHTISGQLVANGVYYYVIEVKGVKYKGSIRVIW